MPRDDKGQPRAEAAEEAAEEAAGPPASATAPAPTAKRVFGSLAAEPALRLTLGPGSDLGILKANVAARLEARRKALPLAERRAADLAETARSTRSPTEAARCLEERREILAAAELVRGGAELRSFEAEVSPFLGIFARLCPEAKVLSLRPGSPDRLERLALIAWAAKNVAERYYPLAVELAFTSPEHLCRCGARLSPDDQICPGCQFPVEAETPACSAVSSSETDKEAKENFRRAFDHYQGTNCGYVPPEVFAALDAYFAKNNVPSGEFVRAHFALTPDGKRVAKLADPRTGGARIVRTDFRTMIQALRQTHNSGHYGDAYFICREYWGWRLCDLTPLREQIFRDYDRTQVEYNTLIRGGAGELARRYEFFVHRKSNISCWFRLYFHLRARGHPCSEEDFKLPTNDNLRKEYRKLLTEIFEKAGIPVPKD